MPLQFMTAWTIALVDDDAAYRAGYVFGKIFGVVVGIAILIWIWKRIHR